VEHVEALARERVAADGRDAHAQAWLGLALCSAGKLPAGQAALKRAFEVFRERQAAAPDDDAKDEITFHLHGIANRLLDTTGDSEALAVQSATFVVDVLKLEHPASLRQLAAQVLARDHDAVKATGFLKRALAVDAADPEALYLSARVMARVGRKPQVLGQLQKAIDAAEGTIAVRMLARAEPDFDALRTDAEFLALIDLFPKEEPLRAVYVALDAGDFEKTVTLAEAAKARVVNALDVLYPWREALEQILDQHASEAQTWLPKFEQVQQDIEAREAKDEESPVYARFCGDA
jgi:tetratricopeptide (TPR) repeat protein